MMDLLIQYSLAISLANSAFYPTILSFSLNKKKITNPSYPLNKMQMNSCKITNTFTEFYACNLKHQLGVPHSTNNLLLS